MKGQSENHSSQSDSFKEGADRVRDTKKMYIEITSWLVSAYDFYSGVVKNRKRTNESSSEQVCDSSQQVNKNRTSAPTMKLFVYFISTEISFKQ